MEHLTIEDIIQFVTISVIDENSFRLASRVNTHILQCDQCRKKVSAFQTIYDKLLMGGTINHPNTVDSQKFFDALENNNTVDYYR